MRLSRKARFEPWIVAFAAFCILLGAFAGGHSLYDTQHECRRAR